MILLDVNVLINAFRSDTARHDTCRALIHRMTTSGEMFGVSPLALAAVVRITTNRRAFAVPSTASEAIGFCSDLLTHPTAIRIVEGAEHWTIFSRLCQSLGLEGKIISDAWFAALAIEKDCEWTTLDSDYAKFPGLRWRML